MTVAFAYGNEETAAPAKTEKTETKKAGKKAPKADKTAKAKKETRDSGLTIEDLKVGDGMEAKEGSKVTVFYRGTFQNGKEFDSNMGKEPISFNLDKGHLIAGWVEGIPGMKVHGKRKLMVPYKLAYGESGTPDGTIPPKADLNFEVELLKVE
jgi:FK506-binding nuclear protein